MDAQPELSRLDHSKLDYRWTLTGAASANQIKGGTNGRTRQLVNPAGGATSFITGTAVTPTFGSFAGVAYISYLLA